MPESFGELLGPARAVQALDYHRAGFRDAGWRENRPYPGRHGLLDELVGAGHRCFVATAKPQVFARRIVEHCATAP